MTAERDCDLPISSSPWFVTVGHCSNCGGKVLMPRDLTSVPRRLLGVCEDCRAEELPENERVVPMGPPRRELPK